jgi:hypothetical protein
VGDIPRASRATAGRFSRFGYTMTRNAGGRRISATTAQRVVNRVDVSNALFPDACSQAYTIARTG